LCTGYAGFVGAIARATTGRPLALTEHGIYHRERSIEIDASRELRGQQRDQWKELFFALSRLSYACSDRIITLFEANRRLELNLGAPAHISQVIPNGIDLPRFRGVVRETRPGFHVGMIVPIKDIKTFIVAARGVIEQIPETQFYCIGPLEESPEYVEECRDLAQAMGISEQFHFTGRQNVLDYYSFLNVVVLSSLSEAQPLVILEAQAAGVPVVATRVGDVPGLLEDDDRFIALPKDAEGIVRRIVGIHHDPEGVAGWIAARSRVLDTVYDRKVIYGAYGSLYRELVDQLGTAWQE
ncbi:MAG: GT4 family glycosyltransferase PelF, partial [Spirochaetia bacterium]